MSYYFFFGCLLLASLSSSAGAFTCTKYGAPRGKPYSHEIINDIQSTCGAGNANNACTNVNACNTKLLCPACDIYYYFSWKAPQNQQFTNTGLGKGGHALVLPVQPCRGAEDWKVRSGACGGEDIWDYAWKLAGAAPNNANYGLAINSAQQRSRQQLHVHVAKINPSILSVIKNVAKFKDYDWVSIVCATGAGTRYPKNCTWNKDPNASRIQAKYVDAPSPSAALPYEIVYGDSNNELTDSMMVTMPTGRGVVILRFDDRQAECFLQCDKVCQDHCQG